MIKKNDTGKCHTLVISPEEKKFLIDMVGHLRQILHKNLNSAALVYKGPDGLELRGQDVVNHGLCVSIIDKLDEGIDGNETKAV